MCLSVHAASDVVFVLDGKNIISNDSVPRCEGVPLLIGCGYRETVHERDLSLWYISVTPPRKLPLSIPSEASFFEVLSYNLSGRSATGDRQYQCAWKTILYNVTIHFSGG